MAVVNNIGYEIGLSQNNNIDKHFSYNVIGYVTKIRNEVVDLQGEVIINSSGARITQKGYSSDSWYVLKTDGLFQNQAEVDAYPTATSRVGPGNAKYTDLNGDRIINGDDRYIAGNTFPEYTYSFDADAKFKEISIQTFWQGVEDIAVRPNGNMTSPFNSGTGFLKERLLTPKPRKSQCFFTKNHDKASVHGRKISDSDFWLVAASFVRSKNIQIAYDFPGRCNTLLHNIEK